jgi:RNase P subunit RPR2
MPTVKRTACARCGISRERKSGMCRDCRSVLTPAEWAIWNDQPLPVESYHEKEQAA